MTHSDEVPATLSSSIKQLANTPAEAQRTWFYAVLKQSKLGLRVEQVPANVTHLQTYVTKPGDDVRVCKTRGLDGNMMLLAFADVAEWHKANPAIAYAEVDSKTALQMAVSGDAAGIVINSIHQAWTALTKEQVLSLLQQWG